MAFEFCLRTEASQRSYRCILLCRAAMFAKSGSALHVLKPLHLHAAEGGIRLRQQSALVLAPCGPGESEGSSRGPPGSPPEPALCPLDRLSSTGLLIGASIVISSAASISVGEGASIRFLQGPRSFGCRREGASSGSSARNSPQSHGTPEGPLLGVGLLAGERLLLHGNLGIEGEPSDCLPAPFRQTPLLLFGGREVSVRGEQQLDRLVILSQGTVNLAGTSTVGPPHRCTSKPTQVIPKWEFKGATRREPRSLKSSGVCSALEIFASACVAPQLQASRETQETSSEVFARDLGSRSTRPFSTKEEDRGSKPLSAGTLSGAERDSGMQGSDEGPSQSETRLTLTEETHATADKGRLARRAVGAFRWIISGISSRIKSVPFAALAEPVRYQEVSSSFANSTKQTAPSRSFRLRRANKILGDREPAVDALGRVEARDTFEAPRPLVKIGGRKGCKACGPPLSWGPFVPGPIGPLRSIFDSFMPPPLPDASHDSDEGVNLESHSQDAYQRALLTKDSGDPHLLWGPWTFPVGLEGKEEGFPASVEDGMALELTELLQEGGTPPWGHLDAAIFAKEGLVLESGASLVGGALLLCGGEGSTLVQGTIDASRRGCPPTHGENSGSLAHARDTDFLLIRLRQLIVFSLVDYENAGQMLPPLSRRRTFFFAQLPSIQSSSLRGFNVQSRHGALPMAGFWCVCWRSAVCALSLVPLVVLLCY